MCRLLGYRSQSPVRVAHELLDAANALRVQSREHPDGWGVGWYVGGAPFVTRALAPAHADEDFAAVGQYVQSTTVIAHVRRASVGKVALANTHPFEQGRWLFVHNGTIPAFDRCGPRLEATIEPSLRRRLTGETDSERCFHLFLTHLARRCDPDHAGFDDAAAALSQTVSMVRACADPLEKTPPSTTFLVTDGRLMLACRSGRTLHLDAPAPDADGRVAFFVVSSEDPCGAGPCVSHPAPSGEQQAVRRFRDVPEGAIVGVDGDLRLRWSTLAAGAIAA